MVAALVAIAIERARRYRDAGSKMVPHVGYFGPTYRQTKDMAWSVAKEICRPITAKVWETDLIIRFSFGGEFSFRGLERYDRHRGNHFDGAAVDEFADCPFEAWTEVIRPALSDRQGDGILGGTPKGYNHFHKLFQDAKDRPGWWTYQSTTAEGGIVLPGELEDARRDLDEATYRQEYEASFEDLATGRVYFAWSESSLSPTRFDPDKPLLLGCDFNVNPMAWVVCQEHRDEIGRPILHVLDEIVLPDSNTPRAADEFIRRAVGWAKRADASSVRVNVYGDASGANRASSGSKSDWEIIRKVFGQQAWLRADFRLDKSNPPVRDRVNAVNNMLSTVDAMGFGRRLLVPQACSELVTDLRQVVWATDAHGNQTGAIDKKKDPSRTHVSDALGYLCYKRYALRERRGAVGELLPG